MVFPTLCECGALFLACFLAKALQSCSTLCDPHGPQPTRLLCPWDSLVMSRGVG